MTIKVELEPARLHTMAMGRADEVFTRELQRVIENVLDQNTDPEAKRTITVEFTFKSDHTRAGMDVKVAAKSKLAGYVPQATKVWIHKHRGDLVAVEHDPRQGQLALDESNPPAPFKIVGGRQVNTETGEDMGPAPSDSSDET